MAATALVLAACGDGDAADTPADTPADGGSAAAELRATDGDLGTFLVDAEGRTLYLFTADSPGVSTCEDACLAAWPALATDGAPVAGAGVDAALLGTLTREDGTEQVTYGGWPLYLYAADMAAGDTTGQGVNDVWFVVAPDGTAVEDVADADTGMGGGYGSGAGADEGYGVDGPGYGTGGDSGDPRY